MTIGRRFGYLATSLCLAAMMVGCGGGKKYNNTVVDSVNRLNDSLGPFMYQYKLWKNNVVRSFNYAELEQAAAAYARQVSATKAVLDAASPPDIPQAEKFHAKLVELVAEMEKVSPIIDDMTKSIGRMMAHQKDHQNPKLGDAPMDGIRKESKLQEQLERQMETCFSKTETIMTDVRRLHRQFADALDAELEVEPGK